AVITRRAVRERRMHAAAKAVTGVGRAVVGFIGACRTGGGEGVAGAERASTRAGLLDVAGSCGRTASGTRARDGARRRTAGERGAVESSADVALFGALQDRIAARRRRNAEDEL